MIEAPEDEITLRVSSFGFRLLGYELKNVDPIKIDVKRKARQLNRNKNIYYWLPNLYREELEAQLDGQTSLLRLEPDTVFFVLSDRVKKTVPVISKLKKEYAPGYLAYNKEELKPSSVVISGPKILIDSITSVQTKGRVISAISGDINQKVKIDFSHDLITVNPQIVQYKQEVDQFTEKELELPIDLKNVQPDQNVNIIPSKIKVFCKVALRDYNQLNQETVKVVCDLNQLIEHPHRKRLNLEVSTTLEKVEIMRLSHQAVDFLVFNK